jgi:putative transposase
VETVNRPQTEAELHRSVKRGTPFGSATWQVRIAKRLGLESTLHPRGRPRKERPVDA